MIPVAYVNSGANTTENSTAALAATSIATGDRPVDSLDGEGPFVRTAERSVAILFEVTGRTNLTIGGSRRSQRGERHEPDQHEERPEQRVDERLCDDFVDP